MTIQIRMAVVTPLTPKTLTCAFAPTTGYSRSQRETAPRVARPVLMFADLEPPRTESRRARRWDSYPKATARLTSEAPATGTVCQETPTPEIFRRSQPTGIQSDLSSLTLSPRLRESLGPSGATRLVVTAAESCATT